MPTSPAAGVTTEPSPDFWRDPATYDGTLQRDFIAPLEEAVQLLGRAPYSLQLALLQQLHWYFTVDLRERAPTVALTPAQAPAFHDRIRQIMRHIDAETLEALDPQQASPEVRHALLSYQDPVLHSSATLDAYDHDQGLVRLSYYVHGGPPAETFMIDEVAVAPAYAKYRACRYYHRMLLRQRIAWLPVASARTLKVLLDGALVPLAVGPQPFAVGSGREPMGLTADEPLPAARAAYPPGKGGRQALPRGWAGWKVRLLRGLARLPIVQRKFAKAWVFADRDEDADDNAEHLYRWVKKHHPEINAWFMLNRSSSDWNRLAAEGFRLVPPGLKRKLLILNCEHVISSHVDYEFGRLERAWYGDLMKWRFTFVPHGISKDDVSHWLGSRAFDLFVTTSPAEHESIVGNDTPYNYTEREARYLGLPRRDRLLELTAQTPISGVNVLLIMPTWRAGLVDDRAISGSVKDRMAAFASSDYAKHWRALLHNRDLRNLAQQNGMNLMFMAHPNVASYIEAFEPPAHVKILTKADTSFMPLLCRSVALITDYTSVAFEMAFLRRMVFYYQFDRKHFYGGDHNWRPGYFDYDRDGFGPIALDENELVGHIQSFFSNGIKPTREYLERMERAMPNRDPRACQRVFENIRAIRAPIPGRS
ncbi:CDP-glycerol glycerophosphotransferase family protein [Polaromonas sp. C04]|uniref:CDP-glycerol glycerophosphotransferase family protein n=1 Tax=Polaromonas sp. C04 TaxID=1945857 RepID=UPI000986E6C1|nr:CDP-glycerol glycerophosphotransferase family protein [Polaromonas sp. C04]OOG51172.1 hypothetical protein B0E49_16235 [Polaromonas sp. C04]